MARTRLFALLWGFCEATFFFLIPDLLFSWLAINHYRQAAAALLYALTGALAGGTLLYLLSLQLDAGVLKNFLLAVPFIHEGMINSIDQGMQQAPFSTLLTSGWTGIPYKVYAICAGLHQTHFLLFIGTSLLMRFMRFGATLLLTRLIFALLRRWLPLKTLYRLWAIAAALLYTGYFILVS